MKRNLMQWIKQKENSKIEGKSIRKKIADTSGLRAKKISLFNVFHKINIKHLVNIAFSCSAWVMMGFFY